MSCFLAYDNIPPYFNLCKPFDRIISKQMTSFHASGHTKEYERILFEKKRGEFNALEIWEDYPIIVPPLAPSNLPFCQIIRAQYIIRVKLHCILLLYIRTTNQFKH